MQKSKNVTHVIIIEEIGLAEIGPHNALKVLHSFLDNMEVAFIGNSNWALDASKNGRGLMVSILNPNPKDLVETALKIEKISC